MQLKVFRIDNPQYGLRPNPSNSYKGFEWVKIIGETKYYETKVKCKSARKKAVGELKRKGITFDNMLTTEINKLLHEHDPRIPAMCVNDFYK